MKCPICKHETSSWNDYLDGHICLEDFHKCINPYCSNFVEHYIHGIVETKIGNTILTYSSGSSKTKRRKYNTIYNRCIRRERKKYNLNQSNI